MENIDLDHCTVEELAYWFWRQRGSPYGSPGEDWLRAEQELQMERRPEWPLLYALGIERETR